MSNGYPTLSIASCKVVAQVVDKHLSEGNNLSSLDDSGLYDLVRLKKTQIAFPDEFLKKWLADFHAQRTAIAQESKRSASWKKNALEEEFAGFSVSLIEHLPGEAVQDLDFWRYLAVFHLRDYINSVEGDFEVGRYGGDGNKNIIRWTLIRGLVWGLRTVKDGDYSYVSKAREIKEGLGRGSEVRDLYISHVIRPAWAKSPGAGRAFIDAVIDEPALFDVGKDFRPWQEFQARVARLSANVYFASLTENQLLDAFLPLRQGIPSKQAKLVE